MPIYLSPHHDDVCYSIGDLAGREGGELVNLYTRSRYVEADMALPADGKSRAEVVTALRRDEDRRFATAAGLSRHDLGLGEPAMSGRTPFDLEGIEFDVAVLSDLLIPCLEVVLSGDGERRPGRLYCPMGIGGHRNHVVTLLTVRAAWEELCDRCTVFLYEDLHYASDRATRLAGIRRASRVFAGIPLTRFVLSLDAAQAERKMRWIGLYASQHARPPRAADFTPASGAVSGLHEIVWRVSPPARRQP
ncbi:MAG TPA: hypothetical protein VII73_12865 [Caulobacteraceae bacterium]